MKWTVLFTKDAQKDAKKIASAGLREEADGLPAVLAANPYQNPPLFERLVGDLEGPYSRKMNIQHRLAYQVLDKEKTVNLIQMWSRSAGTAN